MGRRITDIEYLRSLGVSDENMAIRIGRTPAVIHAEIVAAMTDDTPDET